jgi:hypothetical protein
MGLVAMALLVGREPQVEGNSTLVLNVRGDLQEIEPVGVLGQLFEAPPPSGPWWTRCARPRSTDASRASSSAPPAPQRSGGKCRKFATRSSTSGARGKLAIGFLEYGGEQEFYLASACDKVFLSPTASLDLTGHRELRALSARDARQDRRISRHLAHRRVQDRLQYVHRAHVYTRSP